MFSYARMLSLAALALTLSPLTSQAQENPPDPAQKSFFLELRKLCGASFAGTATLTPGNKIGDPFLRQAMVMRVAQCSDDEIRIPFAVADDHSRTWIIRYSPVTGLTLKHDHRHQDGSLDGILYGGIARNGGTSRKQYFHADAETYAWRETTKTNVWMMAMSDNGLTFYYELDRDNKPLYRMEFNRLSAEK